MKVFFLALALLTVSSVAGAQVRVRPPSAQPAPGPRVAAPAEPGSELTITLLTMGGGEQVWEQFGHNAVWFHVERPPSFGAPVDVVYNWGIFDSSQPYFIPHFLQGRRCSRWEDTPIRKTSMNTPTR